MAIPTTSSPGPETGIGVWVVEDNDLLRETIVDLIRQTPGLRCTFSTGLAEEAVQALADDYLPQVVLMDLSLPGMSGEEAIQRIKEYADAIHIIVLTMHEHEEAVFGAICAGATGYLLKPSSGRAVIQAIESVLQGGSPMNAQIARKVLTLFTRHVKPQADYQLSDREREILTYLVEGYTKKRIAKALFLSPHTVDSHLRNIYGKLHVHSRSEAIAKALRERLI